MRRLAHISDVHFGHEDSDLVPALIDSVEKARPDIIVVSGDLTQRAMKRQFRAARDFLRQLPRVPTIVVPGNHDVSATNLVERITQPLARYHRFITRNMAPSFLDEEIAIVGIDTVRAWKRKDGRINSRQVKATCDILSRSTPGAIRIVVTHHPMDLPLEDVKHALVSRSAMAMKAFAVCEVDLFLSGHLHSGQTLATQTRYGIAGHSAIVAQAGTAVSTRTRGEPNAWNLITLEPGTEASPACISIVPMLCTKATFKPGKASRYNRIDGEWKTVLPDEPTARGAVTP